MYKYTDEDLFLSNEQFLTKTKINLKQGLINIYLIRIEQCLG